MTPDRDLIGLVVERWMPRNRNVRNIAGLAAATGLSRSTVYRVIQANPKTEQATFRRIEAAFGWPSDTLLYVGQHDLTSLLEIGAPTDLIAAIRKEMDKDAGHGGASVGGSA